MTFTAARRDEHGRYADHPEIGVARRLTEALREILGADAVDLPVHTVDEPLDTGALADRIADQMAAIEGKAAIGRIGGITKPVIGSPNWNAFLHPRDYMGRFVEVGDVARLRDGDRSARVTAIDPDGMLTVRTADGSTGKVRGDDLEALITADTADRRVDAAVDAGMPPAAAKPAYPAQGFSDSEGFTLWTGAKTSDGGTVKGVANDGYVLVEYPPVGDRPPKQRVFDHHQVTIASTLPRPEGTTATLPDRVYSGEDDTYEVEAVTHGIEIGLAFEGKGSLPPEMKPVGLSRRLAIGEAGAKVLAEMNDRYPRSPIARLIVGGIDANSLGEAHPDQDSISLNQTFGVPLSAAMIRSTRPGRFITDRAVPYDAESGDKAGYERQRDTLLRETLVHESAHIYMLRLLRASPAAAADLDALINEPVVPRDMGYRSAATGDVILDMKVPRWTADHLDRNSPYAMTNEWEWFAEAFADGYLNGDDATESGRRAVAIIDRYFGRSTNDNADQAAPRDGGADAPDRGRGVPGPVPGGEGAARLGEPTQGRPDAPGLAATLGMVYASPVSDPVEESGQRLYGTEPADFDGRLGRCYELATQAITRSPELESATLVNGTISYLGQTPRIGHAWIEYPDGSVWEPAQAKVWPPGVWQAIAKVEDEHRYTRTEAMTNMLKHGHYGPWHESAYDGGKVPRLRSKVTLPKLPVEEEGIVADLRSVVEAKRRGGPDLPPELEKASLASLEGALDLAETRRYKELGDYWRGLPPDDRATLGGFTTRWHQLQSAADDEDTFWAMNAYDTVVEDRLGDPIEMEVTRVTQSPDGTAITVMGEINRPVEPGVVYGGPSGAIRSLGRFTRVVTKNPDGTKDVEHRYFSLDDSVQGQSIGDKYLRHEIEAYLADPQVRRVTMEANIDVGGYAWAQRGFTWDPEKPLSPEHASILVDRIEEQVSRVAGAADDPDVVEALRALRAYAAEMAALYGKPMDPLAKQRFASVRARHLEPAIWAATDEMDPDNDSHVEFQVLTMDYLSLLDGDDPVAWTGDRAGLAREITDAARRLDPAGPDLQAQAARIVESLRVMEEIDPPTVERQREIADLIGSLPTPKQIANLASVARTYDNYGVPTWPGKEALLGFGWHAVMGIHPEVGGPASAPAPRQVDISVARDDLVDTLGSAMDVIVPDEDTHTEFMMLADDYRMMLDGEEPIVWEGSREDLVTEIMASRNRLTLMTDERRAAVREVVSAIRRIEDIAQGRAS